MTKLQAMYQLKMLKERISTEDWESPKIEALKIAMDIIMREVAKEGACYFESGTKCSALTKKNCFLCPFKLTKEEYFQKQETVAKRLERIGGAVKKELNKNGEEIYKFVINSN